MSTSLAAIAFTIISTMSPVAAPREVLPGWAETPAARLARYRSIGEDVGGVVEASCNKAEDEKAIERCRRWALPLLIGISFHESGWAPDVDAGQCWRGLDGKGPRCDSGLSHSIFQIRTGGEEAKLFDTDRKAAARAALRHATRSWNACRKLPVEERLAAYAGGVCTDATARRVARSLWGSVTRAMRAWPIEEQVIVAQEP